MRAGDCSLSIRLVVDYNVAVAHPDTVGESGVSIGRSLASSTRRATRCGDLSDGMNKRNTFGKVRCSFGIALFIP